MNLKASMMRSIFVATSSATIINASRVSHAPNFAITADLPTDNSLAIAHGWNLTSYHITPCYDYAVFTNLPGRLFYANGTTDQFTSHTSTILSDGGTPPWPWGTFVGPSNQTDAQGRRNVFINCGTGTPGLTVERKRKCGNVAYGTGKFYVCNSTLLYGPAITLYYREKEDGTPQDCADVELKTKCSNNEVEHQFQRDSWCATSS